MSKSEWVLVRIAFAIILLIAVLLTAWIADENGRSRGYGQAMNDILQSKQEYDAEILEKLGPNTLKKYPFNVERIIPTKEEKLKSK